METGKEIMSLKGHKGEIVSMHFNSENDKLLTGSFDKTARVYLVNKIWDLKSGTCIHVLDEHQAEISCTQFEFTGELCATGSIDRLI